METGLDDTVYISVCLIMLILAVESNDVDDWNFYKFSWYFISG